MLKHNRKIINEFDRNRLKDRRPLLLYIVFAVAAYAGAISWMIWG